MGYGVGVLAFRYEYFTISCYLLLRHVLRYYVYKDVERLLFREFVYNFFQRTNRIGAEDDIVRDFVESRQQDPAAIAKRDQIIRHEFFTFALMQGHQMLTKDNKRAFSEADRIAIFLRDNGICQQCLDEGKPEAEARVSWKKFEADHVIPHSCGGSTEVWNGQVLCQYHNRLKGAHV